MFANKFLSTFIKESIQNGFSFNFPNNTNTLNKIGSTKITVIITLKELFPCGHSDN